MRASLASFKTPPPTENHSPPPKTQAYRYREQIDGFAGAVRGWGTDEMGDRGQKVQISGYKINNSWRSFHNIYIKSFCWLPKTNIILCQLYLNTKTKF